jgi:hypothetical protein
MADNEINEIKAGTIMLYGGKPAEIIRVCADNTADIEVPMEWGLMRGNVPLTKLLAYDGEPIEINSERLSGKFLNCGDDIEKKITEKTL